MSKQFEFVGDGKHIRTESELLLIDKEAAKKAFEKYNNQILNPFMKENHFVKYKSKAYVRINPIGLLEYVDLQKESYGSQTFCINFAVMPLYYQTDYLCIGLGERLGKYISGDRDFWWDYADESAAQMSFENVKEAIQQYLFPWFESLSDEDEYLKKLIKDSRKKYIEYPCVEWKKAIDSSEKTEVIMENCEKLKLPKKLVDSYLRRM